MQLAAPTFDMFAARESGKLAYVDSLQTSVKQNHIHGDVPHIDTGVGGMFQTAFPVNWCSKFDFDALNGVQHVGALTFCAAALSTQSACRTPLFTRLCIASGEELAFAMIGLSVGGGPVSAVMDDVPACGLLHTSSSCTGQQQSRHFGITQMQ